MLKTYIQKVYEGLFGTWFKRIGGVLIIVIALYYPLGGAWIENIDKTFGHEFKVAENQSVTLETMSFLINREVNQHMWTPNLPLFFPSYFHDNMQNYQIGIMEAMAVVAKPVSAQVQCLNEPKAATHMTEAARLLAYPGDVWLFSPDNRLKIAPSSGSQYRRARKRLIDFNKALGNKTCVWERTPKNLSVILTRIGRDLEKSTEAMETHVMETRADWFDFRSDDIFYQMQGRAYTYALLLKSLGHDYKQVLLDNEMYASWTKLIRTLENGVELSPPIVRNGELSAVFSPNHLMTLGYYTTKAQKIILKLNMTLAKEGQ